MRKARLPWYLEKEMIVDRADHPKKFRDFIAGLTDIVDAGATEEAIFKKGGKLLAQLIATDNWLDDRFAQPHNTYYQQFLLYLDPQERFSVVSFVWGPGQFTPIHNHGVWALIGMLRGAERSELFEHAGEGQPMRMVDDVLLKPGSVEHVSPRVGDIHRVSNAFDDRVSISIHVYGGNIGRLSRYSYDATNGATKTFISDYTNACPLR